MLTGHTSARAHEHTSTCGPLQQYTRGPLSNTKWPSLNMHGWPALCVDVCVNAEQFFERNCDKLACSKNWLYESLMFSCQKNRLRSLYTTGRKLMERSILEKRAGCTTLKRAQGPGVLTPSTQLSLTINHTSYQNFIWQIIQHIKSNIYTYISKHTHTHTHNNPSLVATNSRCNKFPTNRISPKTRGKSKT